MLMLHRAIHGRPARQHFAADLADDKDRGDNDKTRYQRVFQNFASVLIADKLADRAANRFADGATDIFADRVANHTSSHFLLLLTVNVVLRND
jgi:hypothetical protein